MHPLHAEDTDAPEQWYAEALERWQQQLDCDKLQLTLDHLPFSAAVLSDGAFVLPACGESFPILSSQLPAIQRHCSTQDKSVPC